MDNDWFAAFHELILSEFRARARKDIAECIRKHLQLNYCIDCLEGKKDVIIQEISKYIDRERTDAAMIEKAFACPEGTAARQWAELMLDAYAAGEAEEDDDS